MRRAQFGRAGGGAVLAVLLLAGVSACSGDDSSSGSDGSSSSASATPDEAATSSGGGGKGGTGSSDAGSSSRPPQANMTPVGTHTAVDEGPGRYIPARFGKAEVINTTGESASVARQLEQVALDQGVDPGDVSTAAGFSQSAGPMSVLGAVSVEGVAPEDLRTWYESSIVAGPVVVDSATATAGPSNGTVQELESEMGTQLWQGMAVTDDGTLLIALTEASASQVDIALEAMAQAGNG